MVVFRQRAQRDADDAGVAPSQRFLVGAVGRLPLVVALERRVAVAPASPDCVDRSLRVIVNSQAVAEPRSGE